jgi:peptidoglycan/xylan/chitin deacetylase (PgdA/CDA1 family)
MDKTVSCHRLPGRLRRETPPLILMYHSVTESVADPFKIAITPERFERQMRHLRQRRLRGCAVQHVIRAWQTGRSAGLVGLSFDDGYTDFARTVIPTLIRHGFTATVFVVAERIGGSNDWEAYGPSKPLMTLADLRFAAEQGMEIASHGLAHVSLPRVSNDVLKLETARSRELLSGLLGKPVTGFAYPYGHVGPREVEAVRSAGYEYGCATSHFRDTGIHALPRTYIGERDGRMRMLTKATRHALIARTRR